MTDTRKTGIERFVRVTLGCTCPDEVFQSLAICELPPIAGRPPIAQLVVGSRLLIHVVAPPASMTADGWIEQLVAHGRAARDRHGYHRFRLVIACTAPPTVARGLAERAARVAVGDDRTHLHFVAPEQLPAALARPLSAGPTPSASPGPVTA